MALATSYRYRSDFAQMRPDRDSVMLYDAANAALEAAIEAIDRDDIEGRSMALARDFARPSV